MSESKHTPPPWAAEEESSITKGAVDFTVRSAAGVYLGSPVEGSDEPDLRARGWLPLAEARANTRLMTTAPDLLEALKDLLCYASPGGLHGEEPAEWSELAKRVCGRARAAIRKAEGG